MYRFWRMPFGLTNPLGTFQRVLYILLSGFIWRTYLAYLNDVIEVSKSFDIHPKGVDMVLRTLRKVGVSLSLRKCYFFMDSLKYLCSIFNPAALTVDYAPVKRFGKLQHLRSITKIRSFFELYNLYWRYFLHDTNTAALLTRFFWQVQPKSLQMLNDKESLACTTLEQFVSFKPLLALPRPNLPFVIHTDTSNNQVEAALFWVSEQW